MAKQSLTDKLNVSLSGIDGALAILDAENKRLKGPAAFGELIKRAQDHCARASEQLIMIRSYVREL